MAPPHDTGKLRADRIGEPSGIWPWRMALYIVWQERPDGFQAEVFSGRFRNHHDALAAARRYLAAQPAAEDEDPSGQGD
jgi:hypothetical protein